MNKPTPGPWTCGDGSPTEYGQGYAICAGYQVVARVNGLGYPIGKGQHPESDANARLIAAAPTLLEALKESADVLAKLMQTARIEGKSESENYARHGLATARAALKVAEGES